MKKAICGLFVVEIIIVIVMGIMCATARGEAYARPGIVKMAYRGRVIVETTDGNMWEFLCDGWKKGEHVTLVMDDNGTPDDIYDDVIIWEFEGRKF